ncbi:MAG: glycosyltransferase [Acidimicrobiia bacterium]
MDILQIHNRYRQSGGEDVIVEREAELLRASGHRVYQHQTENPAGPLGAATNLVLAPWNPGSYLKAGKVSDEFQPDVAHVHNTWFSQSPSVIDSLDRRGIPMVMSLHNYRLTCVNGLLLRDGEPCRLCVGRSPLPGVRHKCYNHSYLASTIAAATLGLGRLKKTWQKVSVFLANSSFVKDQYVSAGLHADQIEVKPNFVPDPGPRTRDPEDSDTLLYVGRLSPEKGVEFLTELWKDSPVAGLKLRIIGGGPLYDRLRRDNPEIEFTGERSREKVSAEMLSARALLFPSLAYETNPLAIIEAFAAGLPVVASNRGAMTEMVRCLGEPWLREARDLDDWGEGIQLLADDNHIGNGGVWARKAYLANHTSEVAIENLEASYRRAMS